MLLPRLFRLLQLLAVALRSVVGVAVIFTVPTSPWCSVCVRRMDPLDGQDVYAAEKILKSRTRKVSCFPALGGCSIEYSIKFSVV